jgi:hypothetical protein
MRNWGREATNRGTGSVWPLLLVSGSPCKKAQAGCRLISPLRYTSAKVARTGKNLQYSWASQSGFWRKFSARVSDPSNGLQSFQQALLRGGIQLHRRLYC